MFTAKITHFAGKSLRCPVISNVHIMFDTLVVGTAVLGGRYDEKSAIREFEKFPHKFKKPGVQTPVSV